MTDFMAELQAAALLIPTPPLYSRSVQFSSVHTLSIYFLNIYFNIILYILYGQSKFM
jgi:hypothetical protein